MAAPGTAGPCRPTPPGPLRPLPPLAPRQPQYFRFCAPCPTVGRAGARVSPPPFAPLAPSPPPSVPPFLPLALPASRCALLCLFLLQAPSSRRRRGVFPTLRPPPRASARPFCALLTPRSPAALPLFLRRARPCAAPAPYILPIAVRQRLPLRIAQVSGSNARAGSCLSVCETTVCISQRRKRGLGLTLASRNPSLHGGTLLTPFPSPFSPTFMRRLRTSHYQRTHTYTHTHLPVSVRHPDFRP